MPIYEYVCLGCKTKFELMRPLSKSSEPTECPKCKRTANRALSQFACFTTSEAGVTAPVGGSGCAGCASGSCSTCHT
ncbi:MAG: zinc ribbon domain-containing protein [Chloroflexi bacterium]|nr:zinc ribbon domain-containing protein [Chloroflexota bacterium]